MAFYKKLATGWQYRISYKDSNGKYREKSKKGFKTKALAQAAALEVELQLKNNNIVDTDQTLLDYYSNWAEIYKRPHVTERTWNKYQQTRKHIETYWGNTLLKDITPTKYQKVINEFTSKYSQETTDNFHYHTQLAVKMAVREKIIDSNFCDGAVAKSSIRQKSVEDKFLQHSEYKHLIEVSRNNIQYKSYFAIFLASMTGLRFGEVLGLQWKNIDYSAKMIHLTDAFDYTHTNDFIPLKSKSSKRSIPVSDDILEILTEYHDNFYIPNEQDRIIDKLSNRSVNNTIKKIVGRPVTIHSLRHTYASYLIYKGVDLISVSQVLGHEDLNITLRVYAHQLEVLKEKNNNKIRSIFENFGRFSDDIA